MASVTFDPSRTDTTPIDRLFLIEKYRGQGIPSSLLGTLEQVLPLKVGVILLIRHAERLTIPEEGPDHVLLTEKGKEAACLLGKILREKKPNRLITSPMERCCETIAEICKGADWPVGKITKNPFFSPSGPFIIDLEIAVQEYKRVGGPTLFNTQITQKIPPPGMRPTSEGVNEFLREIFKEQLPPESVNVIVSHDAVTTVLLGCLFGCEFDENNWPDFLDGALFWNEGLSYKGAWRGKIITLPRNC